MRDYIVASCKEWHRTAFEKFIYNNKCHTKNWHYVSDDVSLENCIYDFPPRYIFFLHWNWIVPEKIFSASLRLSALNSLERVRVAPNGTAVGPAPAPEGRSRVMMTFLFVRGVRVEVTVQGIRTLRGAYAVSLALRA